MNFRVSELPYGLLGTSNNYSLPGEFDIQESNRHYVPELPKNVPRDSRGRLPPELMYDIIYESFTDSVHTMITAISGEEFTVGRKMLSTITNGYKFEQSFIRRISSVSHVFRAILRKLLSEVFELGGILLDPAKAPKFFSVAHQRYVSLIPYCFFSVENVIQSEAFHPMFKPPHGVNDIYISPLHQLYFYYTTIRAIRGYKMFRPCSRNRVFHNPPDVSHHPHEYLRVAARTYEAGLNDFADIKRDLEVAYYLMNLVKPQITIERIFRAFEAETAHSMAVDVLFTIVDNIQGAHKRLDKVPERRNWEAGEKERYMEELLMDISDGLTDLEEAEKHYDDSLPPNRFGIECPVLFTGPVIILTRVTNALARCIYRDYDPFVSQPLANLEILERATALYNRLLGVVMKGVSELLSKEFKPHKFYVIMKVMVDTDRTMAHVRRIEQEIAAEGVAATGAGAEDAEQNADVVEQARYEVMARRLLQLERRKGKQTDVDMADVLLL